MHADNKKDFVKLISIQHRGAPKYSHTYVLNELGYKYYKSPKTIYNIVYDRT